MTQIQFDNFRIRHNQNFAFINPRNSIFETDKSEPGNSMVILKIYNDTLGKIPLSEPTVINYMENIVFGGITSFQEMLKDNLPYYTRRHDGCN